MYMGSHKANDGSTKINTRINMLAHRFVLFACRGDPEASPSASPPASPPASGRKAARWHAIHVCQNKLCINFKHLIWGDAKLNNSAVADAPQMYRDALSKNQTGIDTDCMPSGFCVL
jgi:hypothetical protein